MASLLKRVDKAFLVDPKVLSVAIQKVLELDPRNIVLLDYITRKLQEANIEDKVLVNCALSLIESLLSGYTPRNDDSDNQLLDVLSNSMTLLVEKPVPVAGVCRLCRCMAIILPAPGAGGKCLKTVINIIRDAIVSRPANFTDNIVQVCRLWYMWFYLQLEKYERNVKILEEEFSTWNVFSYSALRYWSMDLKPADARFACRLTVALIRLVNRLMSATKKDIFYMLANLQLESPLKNTLLCLSERRLSHGLRAAKKDGVSREYTYILSAVVSCLVTNINEEKKDFARLVDISFSLFNCYVALNDVAMQNVLLLLQHVIYHRKSIPPNELETLMSRICELRKSIPFGNKDHVLWKTDLLSKVGIHIASALKDCKDSLHAEVMEKLYVKILCYLLPRFPKSKDCLHLFRMGVTLIESVGYTNPDMTRRAFGPSAWTVAALVQLYGPARIDSALLTASVAAIRKHGSFLCDQLDAADPSLYKWLSLELYALLRLGANATVTSYILERLRKFENNDDVAPIISVLNLRALAQQGKQVEDLLSSAEDHVLVEAATHAVRFGQRHRRLSKLIVDEIEQSKELMKKPTRTGHETMEELDRLELCSDLPMAHTTLRYGNFMELYADLKWIFGNYQRLKKLPYWVLVSTFVFDDLRTAIGFFMINGDYANQLRALAIMGLLLKKSHAPETLVIETQIRIVEALLFCGCQNNARAVLEKIEPRIKTLELYCEEFFYLEAKFERLRLWLLVEENGPEAPDSLGVLLRQVRTLSIDKVRLFALSRYFYAKGMLQWNLQDSGKYIPTDALDSGVYNIHTCLSILRDSDSVCEVTTWEHFETSHVLLLLETLKSDVLFDQGAVRNTIWKSMECASESQRVFSYYYLLRNIERMIRLSLFFEHSIDSKLSLVSDLIDPKRGPTSLQTATTTTTAASDVSATDEAFDLHTADSIPYQSAMVLKMQHIRVASANKRLPAKEFLKFSKRRKHSRNCRCMLCKSVGIDLTLKQIDAATAHLTKDGFDGSNSCIVQRLETALRSVLQYMDLNVCAEQACDSLVRAVRIRHTFNLAQGYAAEGSFDKALTFLDEIRSFQPSAENELELQLRSFEYTYQIDWQSAISRLGIPTNVPVPIVPVANALKTPAATRKPVVSNAPGRRGVRFAFLEADPSTSSSSSSSSSEEPREKKKPVPTVQNDDPTATAAVAAVAADDNKPKSVRTARPRQEPKTLFGSPEKPNPNTNPNADSRPKFALPAEQRSSFRVTRCKRYMLDLPRLENSSKKTKSIDDLLDDENEMSLADNFSKMHFRHRLKKPKTIEQCNVDREFETLLDASRKCAPLSKQVLLVDLLHALAFLSARRRKTDEFLFYLEKSVGIGVQLAAVNRGSRMLSRYEQHLLDSEYFDTLRPRIDFKPDWHENIWKWCSTDWTIVQLSAVPEGGTTPGLLVTRYESGHRPTAVYLGSGHDIQFQGSLFRQYESIQSLNKVTLQMSERSAQSQIRKEADERLSEFCSSLESCWMACWKGMFLGHLPAAEQLIVDGFVTKSVAWAEARGMQVDKRMLAIGLSAIDMLKHEHVVAVLSKVFRVEGSRSNSTAREVQDFAVKLLAEARCKLSTIVRRKPVILVLDRYLINVPFESCSLFTQNEVTRMPCMSLVVAHALFLKKRSSERENPFALENPKDGCYCVNPGANLPYIENRFYSELKVLATLWEGECGKPLSPETFRKFLRSKSVYFYCGHGTGGQHMREQIEILNVRAVTFIIGCSSGKMRTFGNKMDAEGYALRLVLGGAPAVLGNLWDVTGDVDLFMFSFLRKWLYKIFPDSTIAEPQLGAAVNMSRGDCRLKALTGAAPVIWGLPCSSYTSP